MGVHRFFTLARDHVLPSVPHTPLPQGTRILVDGNGLAFYLLTHDGSAHDQDRGGAEPAHADAAGMQLLARDHGGDYALLAARVRSTFATFRAAGHEPEVWWDGPDKVPRTHTRRRFSHTLHRRRSS